MTVQDVMTKSPAVCLTDTPLPDVARMMVEHDCGAIPVVESRDSPVPIGMITDRDIVCRLVAEGKCPLEATAADAMTESAVTAESGMSLSEVGDIMERNQIRRVPVTDQSNHVIGIIAQADIALSASPQTTAEVVAEISEDTETKMPMGGAYSG